jgi:hypothetical protein
MVRKEFPKAEIPVTAMVMAGRQNKRSQLKE